MTFQITKILKWQHFNPGTNTDWNYESSMNILSDILVKKLWFVQIVSIFTGVNFAQPLIEVWPNIWLPKSPTSVQLNQNVAKLRPAMIAYRQFNIFR